MDLSALATQLISSAIVGLVTWLGGLLVQQLKSGRRVADDLGHDLGHDLGRVVVAGGHAVTEAVVHEATSAWALNPSGRADVVQIPGIPGSPTGQVHRFPVPVVWPVPADSPHAAAVPPTLPHPAGPLPQTRPVVDIRSVAVQVAALQFGANLIGMFVSVMVGAIFGGTSLSHELPLIFALIQFPLGTLFLAASFFAIALMVEPAARWRHLTFVALGTAGATLLVNALFGERPTTVLALALALIVALFQTFLAMSCGGGLAMLAVGSGTRKRANRAATFGIAAWPTRPATYGPTAYGPAAYGPAQVPGAPVYPYYPPTIPQPSVSGGPRPAPGNPPTAPRPYAPSPALPAPVPYYPCAGSAAANAPSGPSAVQPALAPAPPNAAPYGQSQPSPFPPQQQAPANPPGVSSREPQSEPRPAGPPHFQPW